MGTDEVCRIVTLDRFVIVRREGAGNARAGIVDQNVDPSEGVKGRLDDHPRICRRADRQTIGNPLSTHRDNFVHYGLGWRDAAILFAQNAAAIVIDDDGSATARQFQCIASPHAAACARHDGYLAGKIHGHAVIAFTSSGMISAPEAKELVHSGCAVKPRITLSISPSDN